jgi:predicted MPP superfamily phosphohydrolase
MVAPFEQLGLRVLANETVTIRRGGAAMHVTGLDDVHYFYTDAAGRALSDAPAGCKIALVHSPEAAHLAARAGYALYLCGHTHAGQICLPGGQPIITNSAFHWRHARGMWRRGAMLGYTSPGAGTSGLPVRYFSRGEVTVLTLRRAAV